MSNTIKKNVLAYETLLYKQIDQNTIQETWDADIFMDLLNEITGKEKTERAKRKQNEWVITNLASNLTQKTYYGYIV